MSGPLQPSFPELLRRLDGDLALVDSAMRQQLASPSQVLPLLGEHVLGAGGKRMRPALVLLAAELCDYTGPRRVQVGAAIELVHTATLLHDDVVDLSERRRGQASAHAIWGNRRAVLGGDFLYARASQMIVEDGDPGVLSIFTDAIRGMAEGELLQLEHSFDPGITESHYFQVIDRKSALLLSASSQLGAVVAGVTQAERRRLAEFGRELGLAFQLRDDALDYEDREAELGKQPYDDLREGKVTFPLLLALKRCTASQRAAVGALLKSVARSQEAPGESAEHDLGPAIEAVRVYRGIGDTIRRAEVHAERARSAIAPFSDSRAKRDLIAAAEYAVARDR